MVRINFDLTEVRRKVHAAELKLQLNDVKPTNSNKSAFCVGLNDLTLSKCSRNLECQNVSEIQEVVGQGFVFWWRANTRKSVELGGPVATLKFGF